MTHNAETIRALRERGYPDNIFSRWGIILDDGNRKQAKDDLEKLLANLPSLNRHILELRYQKFLSVAKIADALSVPPHIVRRSKEEMIRQLIHTKTGIELYRKYRRKGE